MEFNFILEILFSAPILFFLLGVIAKLIRSDLEIPHPLPKLFSLYVLLAIGIRGGIELMHTKLAWSQLGILALALIGSIASTCSGFFLFKKMTSRVNAIALAASYGSISAVTFITGASLLDKLSISYGPYMIAAMALMEFPAILVALILNKRNESEEKAPLSHLLHHALTNNSVVLLIGGFIIGLLLSQDGWKKVEGFYSLLFPGMLTLFLLDLGLAAARRLDSVLKAPRALFITAIAFPFFNALLAFGLSALFSLGQGDAFLLMLLFGSASYIAAPAAMRTILPEASPGLYLSMALGITFPFNIVLGIPLYLTLVRFLGGS